MAVINLSLVPRDTVSHLAKRSNWASENSGVVLVFCIVFVVGVGLIGLFIYKKMIARRERKARES
ncbi:hypothetical protein VTJ49DRAFT_4919 [Mycothermus thermophilus]|uniref:Uncharacterized protein n=1 Tax=Humicola insolens TaxID=85995 RepID=A0ABR3V460_HUMIN